MTTEAITAIDDSRNPPKLIVPTKARLHRGARGTKGGDEVGVGRSEDADWPAVGREVWVYYGPAGPQRVKVPGKIVSVDLGDSFLGSVESVRD
jgi:hypothetical protein